jgi:hypothetical protein
MKLSDFTNLSGQFVKPRVRVPSVQPGDLYQPSK